MASSLDNLDFLEPWLIPSAFWFSDAEPLFLADHALPHSVPSSIPDTPRSVQSVKVSVSGSGSDPDSRKRSSPSGPVNGRVSKRKPRPSKKSTTTYITADASNFQEMVQQATGVNFSSVLKPQTKRIGAASTSGCGPLHYCLPTLDTSAFLLDHHYQQVAGHSGAVDARSGAGKTCTPPDFDKLACFPTLDSWKVM